MTIKDQIEHKIEFLWSEKTNIFGTGEPYGFSDCSNDIIEIFTKLIDSKIEDISQIDYDNDYVIETQVRTLEGLKQELIKK